MKNPTQSLIETGNNAFNIGNENLLKMVKLLNLIDINQYWDDSDSENPLNSEKIEEINNVNEKITNIVSLQEDMNRWRKF